MKSHFGVAVGLVFGLVVPSSPGAPGLPQCEPESCAIALTEVGRFPGAAAAGLPDVSLFVTDLGGGRFATAADLWTSIVVFDRSGRVEGRFGARGGGPGQFQRITRVVTDDNDGALLVYDAILRRLTRLSQGLQTQDEQPMPYEPAFVRGDDTLVVAQQLRTRDLAGYPLHVVDRSGEVLRSFGAEPPEFRSDMPRMTTKIAAPASDGSVWTISPGQYLIEKWDPETGRRTARLQVASPWFTPSARFRSDEREPPNPTISSIWEADGVVWILLRDADENWQVPSRANEERRIELAERNRIYDSVLEAIHPETGAILASRRFDESLWGRPPDPLLARLDQSEGQDGTLVISTARLEPKGGFPW